MDALEGSDLELDLQTSPAEKLKQALELMATGLVLQRETIRRQNPDFDEPTLDRAFQTWLFSDER